MHAILPVSQTRHEPVTVRPVLLRVGWPGMEQYAAVDVQGSGGDLFDHLDRLEDVLTAGWHVPLAKGTLVDRATALELIDQLRLCVPEQVQAARRRLEQREQVLELARAEAATVLADARHQLRQRGADALIAGRAAARAAQIVEQARCRAEIIQRQADEDAAERLRWLRVQLDALDQLLVQQTPAPGPVDEPVPSSDAASHPPAASDAASPGSARQAGCCARPAQRAGMAFLSTYDSG